MSLIGKKPVAVPSGVKVSLKSDSITIEGKNGSQTMAIKAPVQVTWDEGEKSISVVVPEDKLSDKQARAMWGTTRALINNMIKGVSEGFTKKLIVEGVGWNASMAGPQLKLQVGYAVPVTLPVPQGLTVTADKQVITVTGSSKQSVGQFAAVVRGSRPPEPYNGKGVRYSDEVIRRKQGKQFGS